MGVEASGLSLLDSDGSHVGSTVTSIESAEIESTLSSAIDELLD